MPLFKRLLLSHSVDINSKPEKIWKFFEGLEKNYKIWHPKDHITFEWTEGKPLEQGSRCYAEQYVNGKVTKYNAVLSEIIPNRKITFKWSYPVSVVSPKIEWIIEPVGNKTRFTAITHFRAGHLFKRLFKKGMENLIKEHDKHVAFEGENLKKLMESG